jgi:hypothetical protein
LLRAQYLEIVNLNYCADLNLTATHIYKKNVFHPSPSPCPCHSPLPCHGLGQSFQEKFNIAGNVSRKIANLVMSDHFVRVNQPGPGQSIGQGP